MLIAKVQPKVLVRALVAGLSVVVAEVHKPLFAKFRIT